MYLPNLHQVPTKILPPWHLSRVNTFNQISMYSFVKKDIFNVRQSTKSVVIGMLNFYIRLTDQ